MSWLMIFLDGPLAGPEHDRTIMGKWQREVWMMPLPEPLTKASPDGWMLVGGDGFKPEPPWPGQVHYVIDDERSQLLEMPPGENEGWAAYRLDMDGGDGT